MIIKKKPIFIISMVILLVIVGYINNQLTKQSLKQSSDEYREYEENLVETNILSNEGLVETISESTNKESVEVVDSKENEIEEMTEEVGMNIDKILTKEENMKKANYFIEYRLKRDKLRASLIDRLNGIVNNENTTDKIREQAQQKIMDIGDLSEKELYIEGLIKSKGFEDALVFLNEQNARVVVLIDDLTQQDVMKILDIVMEETKLEAPNIKIMKKF